MESQFDIDMNEFLPLREVVFNTLRKAILTGQLKPGDRLMEVHLANKLGVSRTPIREAIHKQRTARTQQQLRRLTWHITISLCGQPEINACSS